MINSKVKPELNDYARELGFDGIQALSDWLNQVKKKFGMRVSLGEIGASQEALRELVDSSMASGNMANNIAQIGREGVLTIFKSKL